MIKDPEQVADVGTKVVSRVLGVTTPTVRNLAKQGVIEQIEGAKNGHWNLLQVVPAYVRWKLHGRRENKRESLTYQQERKLRLANDEAEGKLIKVEHASAVFAEFASAIRAGVTALPGRVSSQIAGMSKPNDIRKLLNDEVDDLLRNAETQLGQLLTEREAASGGEGGDDNPEADTAEKPRSVGRRKSSPAKGKRRTRKVAKQ